VFFQTKTQDSNAKSIQFIAKQATVVAAYLKAHTKELHSLILGKEADRMSGPFRTTDSETLLQQKDEEIAKMTKKISQLKEEVKEQSTTRLLLEWLDERSAEIVFGTIALVIVVGFGTCATHDYNNYPEPDLCIHAFDDAETQCLAGSITVDRMEDYCTCDLKGGRSTILRLSQEERFRD